MYVDTWQQILILQAEATQYRQTSKKICTAYSSKQTTQNHGWVTNGYSDNKHKW